MIIFMIIGIRAQHTNFKQAREDPDIRKSAIDVSLNRSKYITYIATPIFVLLIFVMDLRVPEFRILLPVHIVTAGLYFLTFLNYLLIKYKKVPHAYKIAAHP